MGEIADMMIGGDLCEGCGSALDGEGYGVPRYCSSSCAKDRGYDGISSDGTGFHKGSSNKRTVPFINRNFSVKVHYNGELMLSVKECVGTDKQTREDVIRLVRSLQDALGEVSDKGSIGGSVPQMKKGE